MKLKGKEHLPKIIERVRFFPQHNKISNNLFHHCLIKVEQLYMSRKKWDIPKRIQIQWNTGFDTAPYFVQLCRENIRFYATISGWQVIEMDNKNIPAFY